MGAFNDFLTAAKTFDSSPDRIDHRLQGLLNRFGDFAYPAGTPSANEVQTMTAATQTSGNMTLTVLLASGETFTTANILFSATAATVEGAIDTAATSAGVAGWTNGDISVAGGAVNAAPVTFTFDGASVSGSTPALIVLNDVDGAGGAWGTLSVTTNGQPNRPARALLHEMGILAGTPTPAGSTAALTPGGNVRNLSLIPEYVIRALAEEAAIEETTALVSDADSKAIELAILTAAGVEQQAD